MIGLGTAMKLYPLFLLGALARGLGPRAPLARPGRSATLSGRRYLARASTHRRTSAADRSGSVFWTFNSDRGADLGSVWLMLEPDGHTTRHGAHTINVVVVGASSRLVRRRSRCSASARP